MHRAVVTVVTLLLGSAFAAPRAQLPLNKPPYVPGRDVMVHLFEWKWNDIANECEQFLGPMGYAGVQTSPVQENVIVSSRPWWERYQPLSYHWTTRSGNEQEFRDMVRRCNNAGVRIFVDAIVNHMSADHPKVLGTGGSVANPTVRDYPAVPYNVDHFNPYCPLHNYNNPYEVRNCELSGLHDLNQRHKHVRDKIVEFLNALIEAGVAGFRIDAAKHMWPEDLQVIYSRLNHLNTAHGFSKNSRPYIYQEVIDMGGEAVSKMEYNGMAAVTEFRYGYEISKGVSERYQLKLFGGDIENAWQLLPNDDALVFIDNHDNQRNYGSPIITHKSSRLYKIAVALMLAYPYGKPQVMSSFAFDNFDQGPPADSTGNIISPVFKDDMSCEIGWICEHRWRQIYNMVRFRNAVNGTTITSFWSGGGFQIAFSRGDRGFFMANADNTDLKAMIITNLKPGIYCDVITGNIVNGACTGKTVVIDEHGKGYMEVLAHEEDGILALHHNAKLPDR